MLLLDTTVLIDVLRGRAAAQQLLALRSSGHVPWVCAISVEEVYRGVDPGEQDGVGRLFDGLRLAPLGRPEGERAGRWRQAFETRGITLAQADCLIAAAAVGLGVRLATGNPSDFPMPELEVEHWPVGG